MIELHKQQRDTCMNGLEKCWMDKFMKNAMKECILRESNSLEIGRLWIGW